MRRVIVRYIQGMRLEISNKNLKTSLYWVDISFHLIHTASRLRIVGLLIYTPIHNTWVGNISPGFHFVRATSEINKFLLAFLQYTYIVKIKGNRINTVKSKVVCGISTSYVTLKLMYLKYDKCIRIIQCHVLVIDNVHLVF